MRTFIRKCKEFHIVSAILRVNMRVQIAGAMYIATPTPKRYAKFRYHNARLSVMLSRLANAMDDPRESETVGLTGEEKRLMEFINKQMETIGLN